MSFKYLSWSGITAADLEGVTKTFVEMQDDLLKLFNDKTVLVGHCISSDLVVLKVLHVMVMIDDADFVF